MKSAEAARQQAYDSINKSNVDLRQLASAALSPRVKERRHSAFGTTAARPHLWLGAVAANGATTDTAAPPSPRNAGGRSHRSSRAGDSIVDGEAEVPEAPGPGAYNSTSSFKAALTKRDILGASSAFKSGTSRLFSSEGRVIDKYLQPGVPLSESPRVGTHDPRNPSKPTIGGAVQAVREQLRKVQQIRAGKGASADDKPKHVDRGGVVAPHGADQPGPGAYDPDKDRKRTEKKRVTASPFRSGSRRALPWDAIQRDAPLSNRARKIEELESATYDGPAPGDYTLPGAFDAAKKAPRQKNVPTSAWAKSKAPRMPKDTEFADETPSAVHYTTHPTAPAEGLWRALGARGLVS